MRRLRWGSPALLLAFALAVVLAPASYGSGARPHRSACTGSTRCDPWGTLELSKGSWLGGVGVDVFSNGATAGFKDCTGNPVSTYAAACKSTVNVNGVTHVAGAEWQCVELINRLYLTQGWILKTWTGNGDQMYGTAPAGLAKQQNGSISFLNPGDVVSLKYSTPGTGGHAAIVDSVNGGTVNLINQNSGAVHTTATWTNGSLTISSLGWTGYTVIGVVHAPVGGTGGGLSITSPLSASAPGGLFADAPIHFSYAVQNASGVLINASVIRVPVRGPHGEILDVNCKNGTNVSVLPGATFICSALGHFSSAGAYIFWADWQDPTGGWHHGQLGPDQQMTLAPAPPLTAVIELRTSAPGGLFAKAPIHFSYTVQNTTGVQINARVIRVPVRGPQGEVLDVPCQNGSNVSLAPGANFMCKALGHFSSAGAYTFWADWQDSNGGWHQGQLGPNQQMTLAPSPPLTAVIELHTFAPGGWFAKAPIHFLFTVQNTTGAAIHANAIRVPVRGPHGETLDVTCANGANVSIAAGASFTCKAVGQFSFAGAYTFWADWQDTGGGWHQGELGPNQHMALAATPRLYITSPLSRSAPKGWYTNLPITFSYTVRNSTTVALSIQVITVAVRDPAGHAVDRICRNGTGLTLAAGQSWTCTPSAVTGFPAIGTYTFWADWKDYTGHWHHGQLGPDQSFTLAANCSVPHVTHKKLPAAEQAITAANCSLGKLKTIFSTIPKGTVIFQHPKTGSELPPGAPMDLTVSKGPKHKKHRHHHHHRSRKGRK